MNRGSSQSTCKQQNNNKAIPSKPQVQKKRAVITLYLARLEDQDIELLLSRDTTKTNINYLFKTEY